MSLLKRLVNFLLGPNYRCRHGRAASEGVCPNCANGFGKAIVIARNYAHCNQFTKEREWHPRDYVCVGKSEQLRGYDRDSEVFFLHGAEMRNEYGDIIHELRNMEMKGIKITFVTENDEEIRWVEDDLDM